MERKQKLKLVPFDFVIIGQQKVLQNSFHTNIFLFFEKQLHVPISEFTFIEIAFEENLN